MLTLLWQLTISDRTCLFLLELLSYKVNQIWNTKRINRTGASASAPFLYYTFNTSDKEHVACTADCHWIVDSVLQGDQ